MKNRSIGRFLVLEQNPADDVVRLAANVFAFRSVTNKQRAIDKRCSNVDLSTKIWEAHTTISTVHLGLRRKYSNLWTS